MKKIFMFLFVVMSFFVITTFNVKGNDDRMLYLHYYRFDENYSNWNVWVWQNEPTGLDGVTYPFTEDKTAEGYNFGGVVVTINLSKDFKDTTKMGIIIRKGDWAEKDVDLDRFFEIDKSKAEQHFYFVQGDQLIGTSFNDPNGPSKLPKFIKSSFILENKINFETTFKFVQSSIKVYENDVLIDNTSLEKTNDKSGKITLPHPVDYASTYKITGNVEDSTHLLEAIVDFSGLYDTDSFNNAFYTEEELGAIYSKTETTFKVWAPLASEMSINIYQTGTSKNLGGSNDKETHTMIKGDKGVYSITLAGDYHGKYYTYNVKNGDVFSEDVVDPYAKGVGVNGLRGLVVDFNLTNPDNWSEFNSAAITTKKTDSIIYELHVRDLTTHNTWNGSEENRGKYLGLIESGTTYEGVTTGFDHIKELGITHLQLLPIFDYGNAIDETRQDDDTYNSFNWGYMPLNFNALEGNYSSDPYNGLTRINEFKQVVMAYGSENIKINMDVVYNHTGQSADSNFNLLVPGYYHRFTASGGFSNGSGTGNEMASERLMVRKYIVESVVFWATEYKLGGFRFDLMALHDIETMNEISAQLHEIDENILVYGEPWMGGSTTLDLELQGGKDNLKNLNNIGAFNDDTRDGLKGSVFGARFPGYIQGEYSQLSRVKYGIVGGIEHSSNTGYKVWHTNPDKTLNYVTAHDNNTLHDKLYMTLELDERLHLLEAMSLSAHGVVLTSQGIPFIHAGDEFLRSKEISTGRFDSNSYQSSDEINQIRWNLKVDNSDHYNKFKQLLEIRQSNSLLRLGDKELIQDNLKFIYQENQGIIAYQITDDKESLVIVVNATNKKYQFDELLTSMDLIFSSNTLEDDNIMSNSFYIFKTTNLEIVAANKLEEIKSSALAIALGITSGVLLLASAGLSFFLFKKKKVKVSSEA